MNDEKDDSPLTESVATVGRFVEKARRFWRTKRAIDRGEPLYDWSPTQIKEANYYAAWKFNAIETALAGGLAAAATRAMLFLRSGAESSPTPKATEHSVFHLSPEVAAMWERTHAWTTPFAAALLTTSVVFLVAWGSLKSNDSTPETRARARRAYLYFDGAFGFFSQLIVGIGIGVLAGVGSAATAGSVREGAFLIAIGVMLIGAVFVQLYVSGRKIPRLLFTINGYTIRKARTLLLWTAFVILLVLWAIAFALWQGSVIVHLILVAAVIILIMIYRRRLGRQTSDPPSSKLTFAQFLGGSPLLGAIVVLLDLLAVGLAVSLVWLTGLLH